MKLEEYLTKQFQAIIQKTPSFVKNSAHFIDIINYYNVDERDMIENQDVYSLHPNIPVNEALEQLGKNENLLPYRSQFTKNYIQTPIFQSKNKFKNLARMQRSIFFIIMKAIMMYFEKNALESGVLGPTLWLLYVDDILIIWLHKKRRD